jgi:hypothetical protein
VALFCTTPFYLDSSCRLALFYLIAGLALTASLCAAIILGSLNAKIEADFGAEKVKS